MTTNIVTLNLSKILKRLELIKNLIALEEEEDILEQANKLVEFKSSDKINQIISLLEQKSYGKAIESIDIFINSHHQAAQYTDPEINALKLEIKSLETTINSLSNEEADLEKMIHEFGIRHNKELGELIIKILRHRKEKAKGTPQQQEAEEDYKNYHQEYNATKNEDVATLTDEGQKELKEKYRKASKLCHPDLVSEEQKELATKLFSDLSTAYEKNDIKRVREILENLEKRNFFINKSDTINEKRLLQAEMEKQRLRVKELKQKLHAIKESDTYKTIFSIDNWDEYFKNAKQKLKLQLDDIHKEK